MATLKLLKPASVEEAVGMLAQHGDEAKVIAGGTALVLMLRNHLIAPAALVSVGRLPGLKYIRHEPGTGLRIGSLTSIRQAETSPAIRQWNPTLAYTFHQVANVRIRYVATIGGNLGEADYASDPPCVLVAMRARVTATSACGAREIPLGEFFEDFYKTAVQPDELLTELVVPEQGPNTHSAYCKFVSRSEEDRPCVGVAAVAEVDAAGICHDLRVVVGAVAERPQEFGSVEAMARGQRLTGELIDEIAEAYAREIDPLSDLRGSAWYRKETIRVFIRRAITQALANGRGGV